MKNRYQEPDALQEKLRCLFHVMKKLVAPLRASAAERGDSAARRLFVESNIAIFSIIIFIIVRFRKKSDAERKH